MPYGNLSTQICQRYASYTDLDRYNCTIEEREEYEPHLDCGVVVYAGVDYGRILAEAENEADIIIWDGGNNDLSFYEADLYITLVDPHRPGHELTYHPGETNLRLADVIIVNKEETASFGDIGTVLENIQQAKDVYKRQLQVFSISGDKVELKLLIGTSQGHFSRKLEVDTTFTIRSKEVL